MRKVIGIGETILDIIFQNLQPTTAVPGGSVFNGIVSLGRLGVPATFISETGDDQVGRIITGFLKDNGVNSDHVSIFSDGNSPVSLAFLDEQNNADYLFYKDYPRQRLEVDLPDIQEDDIVMFGSYFALNPALREKILELLEKARQKKAIIYYDLNFRHTHVHEVVKLTSTLIENLEYADIVRGSYEDFMNFYKLDDPDKIYRGKVKFYCPNFIYTRGAESVELRSRNYEKSYPVPSVETVSTIGAGDNFNAGIIFGLLKQDIRQEEINSLTPAQWDNIIQCGLDLAARACSSLSNSISVEFAQSYRQKR